MRLALLITSGLSLVLAALLVVDMLQPWSSDATLADATGVVPVSHVRVPSATPAVARAPVLHGDEWVATILGRPLFTRDRRPFSTAASVAQTDSGGTLPRLTGIAISPDQRRAIFAGADGAKPIVVEEGGSIAGFTVQTIAPDGVTVEGPGGERSVTLAFDPSPPAAASPDQPQPQVALPPPPYGQPVMPPPYPNPPFPNTGQGFVPGRPGVPVPPNGQPFPRPPFSRPRADLGGTGHQPEFRSS